MDQFHKEEFLSRLEDYHHPTSSLSLRPFSSSEALTYFR